MKKLLIPAALAATIPALIPGAALADNSGPGGGGAALLTADASGQQVYTTVCQGCHMADGKGAVGAGRIPALAGNPNVATPQYVATMVLKGRGAMPSFAGLLSDRQIALVANFVGGNLGNKYKASIKPEEVKATRDLLHKQ